MSSNIKDKVADAGHAVADAAKNMGHKIAEGAEYLKEKAGMASGSACSNMGTGGIRQHMDVIASCGKKVGVVDHLEGGTIKLTKHDSPDGQHHYIPTSWVERVDSHVHLKKNSMETEQGWQSSAASCGCG